jgi:hypothetical protein
MEGARSYLIAVNVNRVRGYVKILWLNPRKTLNSPLPTPFNLLITNDLFKASQCAYNGIPVAESQSDYLSAVESAPHGSLKESFPHESEIKLNDSAGRDKPDV